MEASRAPVFNHASFIWSAADILRGTFKQHQYGDVILPFTVLARLDAVLAPTKQAVLAAVDGFEAGERVPEAYLRRKAGHEYSFFNRSRHDLQSLQGDADNLEENLRDYVNAFSPNVRDIFEQYKIEDTIVDLARHDLLLQILQHFAKVDLHPKVVSNEQMGHIFEELIRRFAEASNETAGEHFTPREVIELMVTLLVAGDQDLGKDHVVRSVYDPTAGTGGMLSVADDKIKAHNTTAQVNLLGQEINPASYAICKADMVVKGQPIENIVLGNTLTQPAFRGQTFHYGLSNPPFGVDWKQSQKVVKEEHDVRGFAGRFGPGLPRVSDGSLLFLMHLLASLRDPRPEEDNHSAGRGAIVLNGSPLFTGGAGSGESNIRKWVLENDYLEAIIGLPTDMFYNTGIATYVWILSKDKAPERRGKVQLIDATDMFVKMRKSVGSKRRMLSAENIRTISELYSGFSESKQSKIFATTDFFYRTITVERPLRLSYAVTPERIERVMAARQVAKLKEPDQAALRSALVAAAEESDGTVSTSRAEFTESLKTNLAAHGSSLSPALLKVVLAELGEHDEAGELVTKAGKPESDASLRDTENVPWEEDVDEYLQREVIPFVPDAWIDHAKTKEGAEIPFTRHFYEYVPPRPLEEIDRDLDEVLGRIRKRLEEVQR
ncbi:MULTISPECIES: type I restriction-modification system subunit M [Brachybacterium]|uniref:site-specific DNA-methyltransferase (adenine-specific) n=2 Tax=Brachybacterium TaxID=43668 RepID=A0A426SHJ4_9MICO|nr:MULTISPECIES: class I SAM-dependent DNA methyltransferase [Brachybacterium]RRR17615.1 SAM-dependent DNA methyltransferase [Brachybacterium paraconglomeratum]GLI29860.1 type I restriction endonuclease subunit M [Brachybacterium conglomeratum]GLK05963.1 type I restriction endonuclease subunit M [Brachybacterium conglomeratum]